MASPRRATTAVVTTLALLVGLAPGAGAHHPDEVRREIAKTQAKADAARDELKDLATDLERTEVAVEETSEKVDLAAADLSLVTAKLEARQADLAAVSQQLADATAEMEAAVAAHEQARTVAAKEEDRAIRSEWLAAQEQVDLDRQVASIYKYGRASEASRWLAAVKSSETINQFGHTTRLLKDASDEQVRTLDRMQRLLQRAHEDRAEAHAARVEAEVQQEQAETLRAEVEQLHAQHESLVVEADRLVAAQSAAVATLESEKASLTAQAADIESAKKRTASELAELEKQETKLQADLQRLLAKPQVSGPAPGMLQFPTAGRVGSRFGYRIHPIYGYARLHAGVDIGAPSGQKILSAASGKVVRSGWCGGYGNCVVVDHGGGLATLYAHMSRRAVSNGSRVKMGQTVGYIGSTGLSTGPHLHFETRKNGSPVNPCKYLSEC